MEYELELELNGEAKKIKVVPGLYFDQTVYQISIDGRSLVIFKDPGTNKWRTDADHTFDADWLQTIGEAVDANI